MFDELTLAQAVAFADAKVRATGRSVEITDDFYRVADELSALGKTLNDESSPYRQELSPASTIYIAIRGDDGTLQAFCAARLINVGGEMLSGYLDRLYRRIYGRGQPAIDASDLPPPAYKASGKIVFISDLVITKTATGKVDPCDLMMLAIGLSSIRFDPDYVYGIVSHRNVNRGLAARYLCSGWFYGALRWIVDNPWSDEDWLLLMPREDYQYSLRRFVSLAKGAIEEAAKTIVLDDLSMPGVLAGVCEKHPATVGHPDRQQKAVVG